MAGSFRFEWRLEGEEIRDVVSDKDEVETEELLRSKERPIPQIMEIDEEDNVTIDEESDELGDVEINDPTETVEEEEEDMINEEDNASIEHNEEIALVEDIDDNEQEGIAQEDDNNNQDDYEETIEDEDTIVPP